MEFVCRVGTPDGRVASEVRSASSARAARADLESSGYHVFEVKPRGFRVPRLRRRRRVSQVEFLVFNRELAGLLKAGLPLLQSLGLLLERQRNPQFAEILTQVRDRVQSGAELSEAFREIGDVFPPLYASTLMAGERSGELEQVIRRFNRFLKLVMDTRRKVLGALTYPAVLVVLAVVMIAVMVVVVIPQFETFYESMDVTLPLPTRILLGLSLFVRGNLWWLVGVTVAAALVLARLARTEPGRLLVDQIRLRLPFVGGIFRRFAISEFSRSLATLLAGGFPLLSSLEVAVGSVSNRYLRRRIAPTIDAVRQGRALNETLEETGVMGDLAIDMIKVGEATGALDEMLESVSDFYDEEIETRLERVLTLLEPLMLVFMAIIVGLLLMAMYMPMFSALGQIR